MIRRRKKIRPDHLRQSFQTIHNTRVDRESVALAPALCGYEFEALKLVTKRTLSLVRGFFIK
jgi:hypothetical protein